jgi:hypothetical protein
MEGAHVTRSPRIGGMHHMISQKWVFKPYMMILIDFYLDIGTFCPFLEDLELLLRPYLGGKLGVYFQLQAYIN